MQKNAISDLHAADAETEVFDVVIVGAGFSGLRSLMHVRSLGLRACVLETGSDVGGTWYWNCYPGARTDSESWYYCFSFDSELLDEWDWTERYPGQPEMHRYLSHVAERFELRRDIRFNTKLTAAHYHSDDRCWDIQTEGGARMRARFIVMGVGILSTPNLPDFAGLQDFRGEIYVTSRWPKQSPDFSRKRVGIIGTGATGVQAIPIISQVADRLTVFQRTPNYVVPAHNHDLSAADREDIKARYQQIWSKARAHAFAMPYESSGRTAATTPDAERRTIFEEGWAKGGFRYMFETFDDLLVDSAANEAASDFIREKIKEIVVDPVTAEMLCPQGYPYGTKRPPAGHFYYEAFNRKNVELVNISKSPIQEITESGIRTADGHHDLDVIIFATGFDVYTGPFTSIDIVGEGGLTMKDKFSEGPVTYQGLAVNGFPNMIVINGPLSPFANMPVIVEKTSDWMKACIAHMQEHGFTRMEVDQAAEQRWLDEVQKLASMTLIPEGAKANSWLTGANIAGKAHRVSIYMGGYVEFAKHLDQEIAEAFPNFSMR
jgi:cation diffusion facilitator CzcD-associated flavoprotein CzcO